MSEPGANLSIENNGAKHRFEVDLGDGTLAIAEYEIFPERIIFTHTQVPPQHEGRGIGSALIRFALRWARERDLKVIPLCPFFAAYIGKHPEEQDLLTATWRSKLGLD